MNETTWYLRTQDETFGPETRERLIEWAQLGRIQPGQEVSQDQVIWQRAEEVPFLDMRFSIDLGDGNPRGPFNKKAAEALIASGRLPPNASIVETREPFAVEEEVAEESEPVVEEPAPVIEAVPEAEPVPEAPVRVVEKIVEKIVEKRVEVPVEVEKIVEKRVEVPVEVEKVVEKIVEKKVVDETRVKELEGLLEEERRHTADLQKRMDEAAQSAALREQELQNKLLAEAKDANSRETKMREQIVALETELRRLPETASEIANIQAAVYGLITSEASDIDAVLEAEKKELADYKQRAEARLDRLLQRRRDLIKQAGADPDEMTRRALANRPEDPRTAQLREELKTLQQANEKSTRLYEARIQEMTNDFKRRQDEWMRQSESVKDVAQLRAEAQELREKLQLREQELVTERQRNENMRQQQALRQQTLMTRLAALESPSIGTTATLATNQSREAKMVKLPNWMRFGK